MQEDPSEDVFVALVNTPRGNFRVFEGIREGNAFHLQRVLNVIETMPAGPPYDRLRTSVESLLRISDAIAERAGVRENALGEELPLTALPADLARDLSVLRGIVKFSERDLGDLGAPRESLGQFMFVPDRASGLAAQVLGHTDLERCPLAVVGGSVYVLLPTAIGSAITRLVVEFVTSLGKDGAFERALAADFADLFRDTPLLGSGVGIRFQHIQGGMIGAARKQVDSGRFLHLVFFVDGLDGFFEGGVCGANAAPGALGAALMLHIHRAAEDARAHPGFVDGLTLLVGCGYGRGLRVPLEEDLPANWRLESVAAHDLVTLAWLQDFDGLSLWRILDARTAVSTRGVELLNMNGLLNLVAWAFENKGHLVPHGELPDDFVTGGRQGLIQVNQNSLRDLRHQVVVQWDPRRVSDTSGRWISVKKFERTFFAEDNSAPLYVSIEALEAGRLRAVYDAPSRPWWVEILAPEGADRHYVYENWMMLCTWLRRAAPVLDALYTGLPEGPISVRVGFARIVTVTQGRPTPKDADELRALIRLAARSGSGEIGIEVGDGFEDGLVQPENVAERVLVEAFVDAVAIVAGEANNAGKRERALDAICPDPAMRYMHRFEAQSFRDYLRSEIGAKPLLVNQFDHVACLVGLGWQDRARELGPEISGVPECRSYLNRVVEILIEEICEALHTLDRRSMIRALVLNHEAAACDRDSWRRTSQAVLALHSDKSAALRAIVDHDGRLGVCFTLSRILIEAAICECPLAGGRKPGELDLSRLLSRAQLVFSFGGDSDAVHWGAMEPWIRVTPLGDIHMKRSFENDIYQQFARAGGVVQVEHAVDAYSRLYAPRAVPDSVDGVIDDRFLRAWEAEFRVSIDGMRNFIDEIERIGVERKDPIVNMARSSLAALFAEAACIPAGAAAEALATFTLEPRPRWRVPPTGFHNRDWEPWRFRRRLAVLRRPFLQIEDAANPEVLFAPGLVREAFWVTIRSYYDADMYQSEIRSSEMESWVGHISNKNGSEFARAVEARLNELGWKTKLEIEMTDVLARRHDPRFGDLRRLGDVDVLAWRDGSPRVLAVECKDVQFRKTPGEVAEQLSDFRGELRPNGKPDLLRRHLDRLEVLTANSDDVAKRLRLQKPIQLEGHLVFRNPVPMKFAWDHMASRVRLTIFDGLDGL